MRMVEPWVWIAIPALVACGKGADGPVLTANDDGGIDAGPVADGAPDAYALPDAGTRTDGGLPTPALLWSAGPRENSGNMVADATRLYWVSGGGGVPESLMAMNKDGTGLTTLTTHTPPMFVNVESLAIDSTSLYWAIGRGGPVAKINLDGSGLKQLATTDVNDDPRGIALDATSIYWTGGTVTVKRLNKDGTGRPVVVSHTGRSDIAVDTTQIYTSSPLSRSNLDGPGLTPIGGESGGQHLVVDATAIYWCSLAGGLMQTMKSDWSTALLSFGCGGGAPLALDGTSVYWADDTGAINAVNKDGTRPRRIALAMSDATRQAIVVDDASVYWIEGSGSGGWIESAPK